MNLSIEDMQKLALPSASSNLSGVRKKKRKAKKDAAKAVAAAVRREAIRAAAIDKGGVHATYADDSIATALNAAAPSFKEQADSGIVVGKADLSQELRQAEQAKIEQDRAELEQLRAGIQPQPKHQPKQVTVDEAGPVKASPRYKVDLDLDAGCMSMEVNRVLITKHALTLLIPLDTAFIFRPKMAAQLVVTDKGIEYEVTSFGLYVEDEVTQTGIMTLVRKHD